MAGWCVCDGAHWLDVMKNRQHQCVVARKYPIGYNIKHLNTLLRSSDFDEWLSHLADQKAKARILARLTSATFGNFGDCEPVGEGVSEMRLHVAAGYRVYYTRTGSTVYVLLAGGVKGSQTKDIAKAKRMARELKRAKP
jgi:putative addiction module killer protein